MGEGSEMFGSGTELELVWHDGHRRGAGLLVVLHGFADHPGAALQLGSLLDPGGDFRICAPVGPIEVNTHKRAFYRSTSRMTPEPSSFAAAISGIEKAIVAASARCSMGPDQVVLAGMSQGAGLAAIAALGRSGIPAPRGLVLFSGRPYPDELVEWDLGSAPKTRIFAAHGTADRLSPAAEMRSFLDRATAHRIDVTWQTHPYGHTLHADSITAASRWLDQLG
jgi:predicted esterase